jgi:hypothetical protein
VARQYEAICGLNSVAAGFGTLNTLAPHSTSESKWLCFPCEIHLVKGRGKNETMKKIILTVMLSISACISGCNNGNWKDAGILLASSICDPKLASDKEGQAAVNGFARLECGKLGKTFTGDYRCEDGAGQIKCK